MKKERKRNLKNFLIDETGFVSKEKLIFSGMICSSLLWVLAEEASAVTSHFNKSGYHANWVTNDDLCPGTVRHINENRHLNHTSSS